MNAEKELEQLTDKIVSLNTSILEYMSTISDDVISNSDLFTDIPKKILYCTSIPVESETFDPLTGMLELTDYLESWKQDVIDSFSINNSAYSTFVTTREALFNDILLKCIAAEKTADMQTHDMDNILELRIDLLKHKLVTSDIIEYDLDFFSIQNTKIETIETLLKEIKNKKLGVPDEFTELIECLNQFNNTITGAINNYITYSISYMDHNKDNIISIDDKLAEIVKVVTVASIMVSASGKKREIAINNYESSGVEYLTATTFMKTHEGRTDQELGKTMKETVKIVSEKKEYTKFFNNLLEYYSQL